MKSNEDWDMDGAVNCREPSQSQAGAGELAQLVKGLLGKRGDPSPDARA